MHGSSDGSAKSAHLQGSTEPFLCRFAKSTKIKCADSFDLFLNLIKPNNIIINNYQVITIWISMKVTICGQNYTIKKRMNACFLFSLLDFDLYLPIKCLAILAFILDCNQFSCCNQ